MVITLSLQNFYYTAVLLIVARLTHINRRSHSSTVFLLSFFHHNSLPSFTLLPFLPHTADNVLGTDSRERTAWQADRYCSDVSSSKSLGGHFQKIRDSYTADFPRTGDGNVDCFLREYPPQLRRHETRSPKDLPKSREQILRTPRFFPSTAASSKKNSNIVFFYKYGDKLRPSQRFFISESLSTTPLNH